MKKIGIVFPTFNRKDFVSNLLSQIEEQKKTIEQFEFFIIVVVDGSTDGTVEMLKNEYPYVHIVLGDGTWWYTKSMNEGFKYAIKNLKPDYILTLNDDLELDKNYLKEMINGINKVKKNSIIGSLSLTIEKPPRVTFSGVNKINKYIGKSYTYYKFLEEVDPKELKGIHKSLLLPGRGMLIPASILKQLNYFDEKFPRYHSDGDFCLRAIKAGFDIYINWDVKLFGYHNMTSKSSSYKKQKFTEFLNSFFDSHSRNNILQNSIFFWRHFSKLTLLLIISIFFYTRIKYFVKRISNG